MPSLSDLDVGRSLAQAIVDTVREPLLVLDGALTVVAASRSFYAAFEVRREETQGRPLYELGDGQWDIPALRHLLDRILPEHTVLEDYEVDHEFPHIGQRNMLLNARCVTRVDGSETTILLAFEDVTKRRATEREVAHLLKQKELLLEEMQHRIANSLQIIASILMLNAQAVVSDETRGHLRDAHGRVMSVAAVQKHLRPSGLGEPIEIGPYLKTLCASLARSMIRDRLPITLATECTPGNLVSSEAVSIGLIVTECVINSLKHAFPDPDVHGSICVKYSHTALGWRLSIEDNGVGKPGTSIAPVRVGLGTSIINALAQQLDARVDSESSDRGTSVTVTRDFAAETPRKTA